MNLTALLKLEDVGKRGLGEKYGHKQTIFVISCDNPKYFLSACFLKQSEDAIKAQICQYRTGTVRTSFRIKGLKNLPKLPNGIPKKKKKSNSSTKTNFVRMFIGFTLTLKVAHTILVNV